MIIDRNTNVYVELMLQISTFKVISRLANKCVMICVVMLSSSRKKFYGRSLKCKIRGFITIMLHFSSSKILIITFF